MGSLAGYTVIGVLLILYGLWWLFLASLTYIQRISKPSSPDSQPRQIVGVTIERNMYYSGLSRPLKLWCLLEPVLKLLVSFVGMLYISYHSDHNSHTQLRGFTIDFDDDGHVITPLLPLHYILLYLAFFLSALIDIVSLLVELPSHSSQIFFALAFLVEAMLFYYQVRSMSEHLSSNVHLNCALLSIFCTVFASLRVFHTRNLVINMGLACCILLQGTWFIQAGVLLFPSDRDHWLYTCPKIPMDIRWKLERYHDFVGYFKTQLHDSRQAVDCAWVGRDDSSAMLVSGSLGLHILAVTLFSLIFLVDMQLVSYRWKGLAGFPMLNGYTGTCATEDCTFELSEPLISDRRGEEHADGRESCESNSCAIEEREVTPSVDIVEIPLRNIT